MRDGGCCGCGCCCGCAGGGTCCGARCCIPVCVALSAASAPPSSSGKGAKAPRSLACAMKLPHVSLASSVRALPSTSRHCLGRVMATFMRRTSARKPMRFDAAARTQDTMTTSRSCPWNPSTVDTLTWLRMSRPKALTNVSLRQESWALYGVSTHTDVPAGVQRRSLSYSFAAASASSTFFTDAPPRLSSLPATSTNIIGENGTRAVAVGRSVGSTGRGFDSSPSSGDFFNAACSTTASDGPKSGARCSTFSPSRSLPW